MMMATPDDILLHDLEAYFKEADLPPTISFAPGSTITNVRRFIEAQFSCARAEGQSPVRKLAVERLQQLRRILETNN